MFERIISIFHPVIIYHFPEHQLKDKKDSFWYDGHTATVYYLLRKALISAEGEIKIFDKDDELIYCNGKDYGNGLNATNDKELYALSNKNEIRFDNNNWFEVKFGFDDLPDVYGDIEEAIEGAKSILQLSYSLDYSLMFICYILSNMKWNLKRFLA